MIEVISGNLPRLEIYLKLQPDPSLDVFLLNIFTDVVEFSVQAFRYFGMRPISEFKPLFSCCLVAVNLSVFRAIGRPNESTFKGTVRRYLGSVAQAFEGR